MSWKIATAVLVLLLLGESGYVLLSRHRPINRFKPVDEDGYLAFDSATGQLCRTFRPGPPKKIQPAPIKPAPSSFDSKESSPNLDRILCAIRGGLTEAEFDKKVQEEKDGNAEAQAELIRSLPACANIR
jgi:hypothetical protein